MPKMKKVFAARVMDKKNSPSYIKQGYTRHAENLRFGTNNGNDGEGKSIKGSTLVGDETGASNDFKCVGAYFNESQDAIYYFLATTDGLLSKVVEYDIVSGNTVVMLHDTTGVLKLDKNGYITGVNEIDGLLYWSEWGNNPRRINIERAKTYGIDGYEEKDIKVILKPPLQKLRLSLITRYVSARNKNNLEDIMPYFSYRWRYLDGEYSVLAPFTNAGFFPKNFDYDFTEQSNPSMLNQFSQARLEFYTGGENVTEIQLVWKESESNVAWVIDDFNKAELGYADDEMQEFIFDNNKTVRAFPKELLYSFFDNVPLTAKAQEIIDGRLIYGNIKENYDLVNYLDEEIEIDFTVELLSDTNTTIVGTEEVPSLNPKKTVKSNIDYEVLIQYLDEDGRGTTLLPSKTNTIYVPASNSITENKLKVVLKNLCPKWARYYRFFIKQNKKHYEQIIIADFYVDGVYRWVKLEGADKDKINEGDYLTVKADLDGPTQSLVRVKVLEVKNQEEDFIDGPGGTETYQAGLYMKIRQSGFNMNFDPDDAITRTNYDSSHNQPQTSVEVALFPIQFGSRVRIFIESWEKNKDDAYWSYDETFVSQGDYTTFKAWYEAEVIDLGDFETDRVNISFTNNNLNYTVQSKEGGYGTFGKRKLYLEVKVQNGGLLIFETEAKREPENIYFEIGRTYKTIPLSQENHWLHSAAQNHETRVIAFPEDTSQGATQDLEVVLDWFNAFSYGNGAESYKIRDEFGKKGLDTGVRSLTNLKTKYQEIHREAGIAWSDVYNEETKFNGLNSFNLSQINFIDLDKEEGSIQKIHKLNGDLLVMQEDAIGILPYNKQIINEVEGGRIVGISKNILNKDSYRPFANGKFGISLHPESFIQNGTRNYVTDQRRGNILRIANDGITALDLNLMGHYISDQMKAHRNLRMISTYDITKDEYLLYLPDLGQTVAFKESDKGFPNFFTFEPDFMLTANSELYAWKNGAMYKMNSNPVHNNFFGEQHESKIKFYFNEEFSVEKIWKSLSTESSHPFKAIINTDLTSTTIEKDCFEKKEDHWYSDIMGNTNDETASSNIFGLGQFEITNGEIITTRRPDKLSIGDDIINSTNSFPPNKIVDITDTRIILQDNLTEASSFLMYKKNQNIDGTEMRGDILEVELISDETEEVTIRAANAEVAKSFYS